MNLDRRLLRLLRGERPRLALTVGLGVLGGVLLVLQARVLSRAIAGVFLGGQTLVEVTPLLLALAGLALARAGVAWLSVSAADALAGRIKQALRSALYSHLLALGPAYTGGERSGELVAAALQGVEELDAYFRDYLPALVLAALVPLTFLAFILPLEPLSGLVLLLTAPLIPFFMVLIGALARGVTRRQWQTLSRMSAHFLDALQGLTTLKLFGRSRRQVEVIASISDRWRATTLGVLRVAFLSALTLELIATLSTAIVAVEIGVRLLYGLLDFEGALFVLVLAPEYYLPLRTLGVRFHAGISGVTAAVRIFDILETPAVASAPSLTVPSRSVPQRMCIAFNDIRYAYDGGRRVALDGVTFMVEPGQQVALVGPSGAGKSTIAALLLRFIAPDSGTITVDGVPLAAIAADVWRARLAWVPQQPYLFNTSILENIRLGRPGATPDEVIFAARQAGADDFICALPDGYATVIGERGARLSGGQAQRIALARAFLRDAPLLILDEPTAHLDAESEALVEEAIGRLLRGRTALIIAHRLHTVARADRIIVLDEGRVIESGSHAELRAAGGLYSRLLAAYDPQLLAG
ncbi:MAG: thiol reductant ABC exporter subunit CydD [Anaerolineae bacterium]|nr:thiol reductant ABC exporter subunit CydD [Anaerolineae bacterium]